MGRWNIKWRSITHTYAEANKEYTVTISKTCTDIKVKDYGGIKLESIIEIEQWGSIGLTKVELSNCINLRKIASPTKNSFVNNDTFSGCTSLTLIYLIIVVMGK